MPDKQSVLDDYKFIKNKMNELRKEKNDILQKDSNIVKDESVVIPGSDETNPFDYPEDYDPWLGYDEGA